jgi:hypothetical protein
MFIPMMQTGTIDKMFPGRHGNLLKPCWLMSPFVTGIMEMKDIGIYDASFLENHIAKNIEIYLLTLIRQVNNFNCRITRMILLRSDFPGMENWLACFASTATLPSTILSLTVMEKRPLKAVCLLKKANLLGSILPVMMEEPVCQKTLGAFSSLLTLL